MKRKAVVLSFAFAVLVFALAGCRKGSQGLDGTMTIRDQVGRTVVVPQKIEKILAIHLVGAKIVFAFGRQAKLVDQTLYGREGEAMIKVDRSFAEKPSVISRSNVNVEQLIALKPDVAFAYAAFKEDEVRQLENAGIKVIGLKAENFRESFEAVRLAGKVLSCEGMAEDYIADCQALIDMVKKRVASVQADKRLKVMFSGPRGIYTVATGEMLSSEIVTIAGGRNVADGLKGFWADVSPEQIAAWNPDVVFVGSTLDAYGVQQVLDNQQFKSVNAVRNRRVYAFPSNIGWWDFPAPHCVLGVVWTAKTLYPDRFSDVDVTMVADRFYTKYMGHSFTAMGGRL
jgi:iron complex transport system substrate-binding protein